MNRKVALYVLIILLIASYVFADASNTDNNYSSEIISVGMANPAAVYCSELGYEYNTVDTPEGQQGFCMFPDGSECDAWNFLMGKCGTDYSYCAQIGYDTASLADGNNPFSPEYAVCIGTDIQREEGFQSADTIIGSVTELMGLEQKATKSRDISEFVATSEEFSTGHFLADAPPSFDWRNHNGQNWMTSVKNQGSCGSCWAFSALGTVEARFNVQLNDPDLDFDLAEQYLVSDCLTCGSYCNCSAGYTDRSFGYIRDNGIPDEACYPYTGSNTSCSSRCSDWQDRIIKLRDYRAYYQPGSQAIKDYIANHGPLSIYLGIGGSFGGYFDGDIYRCTDDSSINHAVVLVGYDDTGGYWILKNSWGAGFGDSGYYKVGYGECSIERWLYTMTPCQDNDGDGYSIENDYCGPADCNDAELTVNPGAQEVCSDKLDNDCDSFVDCDDIDCNDFSACPSASQRVPDTGQTRCYDNTQEITCPNPGEPFYGQDAQYITNPQSYTKLDASGNDLPNEASEWVMVRDNVTGLIWEVKADKDDIQNYVNPHDADNTYTWYDSNPATNGGDPGTPGDGTDTEDFINALNAEQFGGYNNWRMPTAKELSFLRNMDNHKPSINTHYFP